MVGCLFLYVKEQITFVDDAKVRTEKVIHEAIDGVKVQHVEPVIEYVNELEVEVAEEVVEAVQDTKNEYNDKKADYTVDSLQKILMNSILFKQLKTK